MANIDKEMGQFPIKTTMANSDYVVINLADGSQGQIKVSDIASVVAAALSLDLNLSSKLRYGLGGKNHIIGDSSLVNKDVYIYATGFSDGEYVTFSMEADSGTTVHIFKDDGFTFGGELNFDSTKRMRITVPNEGGENMLILVRNGSIRKLMAEHGYFDSEWVNNA